MEPPADAPTEDAAAPEADESAPAGPGEAAEADGENDGQEGGKGNSRNNRTLEQMMSLKPGDDERTQISKKVSWILRHGAKKVNIDIDDDGWVSVENLLGSTILQGVEESRLMDMINESNIQKPRYEVRQTDNGKCVRAVAKHTIQGMTTSTNKGGDRPDRRRPGKGGGRGDDQPDGRGGDREPGGWRAARPPNPPGAGATQQSSDAAEAPKEMAYDRQFQEGYSPAFQGQPVPAMARGEETMNAGKRGCADKGKGRGGPGDAKGKFDGYSDGKAFGRGKPSWPDDQFSGGGYPSDEAYGFQDSGKGFKGKSKDGRGCGYGYGKPCGGGSVPCKWVCQRGQDAIVRATQNIESAMVGAVHPGQVVTQTGDEVKAAHGIMRMPVEFLSDDTGQRMSGWVTRTAEAANGPVYFRPVTNGGRSSAYNDGAAQGPPRYTGGYGYEQGPCGPGRGFDKGGGGFGPGGGCGPRGYGGGHNGYDQGPGMGYGYGAGGYGGGAPGNYGAYGGYQTGKGYR